MFVFSQDYQSKPNFPDSLENDKIIEESVKLYRAILDHNPSSQFALSGLGIIAAQKENWEEVKDNFSRLLEVDENNLEALYYLGIAYRESGKFKALLLRKMDWDKAENFFEKVIEKDSSFQDALFQYAKLKRYRGNYQEAILLGQLQLTSRPDLTEPQVQIFRLYRYLIDHTDFSKSKQWLENQHWPHAQFGVGELWRTHYEHKKADSIYQQLLIQSGEMPIQPVLLALCRLYAEQDLQQKVDSCFWAAVNQINTKVEADLIMEDMKYLLSEEEFDNYNQAVSDSARIAFIEQFWLKRNPLPAAPVNVRLVEHYQRLNYADKNYEYDGFRTWFADPDDLGYLEYPVTRKLNNEYNDKGIIYIRHGAPNETARTAGFEVEINESWLYYASPPNGEMTFHFIIGKPGNDWRFAPIITDPAMLQDRLTWGNIYSFLLNADPLEKLQYREEMALMSQKSVSDGLSTERHTWPEGIETFNFPISIETFRGDTGFSRIDIAYSIPAIPEISQNLVISDDSLISIENGLAILNHEYEAVIRKFAVELIDKADTLERIETNSYMLHPDTYTVAIHLDPKDFNILGGYKIKFGVPDYSGDTLIISDIQLANHIEPVSDSSAFIKEGLSVWPNPAHQFNRKSPVYLYFEIYNLSLDNLGISQFSIDYNLSNTNPKGRGLSNLFGLLGPKEKGSITIKNEHQAEADFSAEYLALDISQMQAGDYELEITVLDELSKTTTANKVQLTLE